MDNKQIIQTIYEQLGGRKFLAMTGSTLFCDGPKLIVQLRRNKLKAKKLYITYNSMDLYDMQFITWNKELQVTILKEYNNVYGDMLQEIFTQETGLNTSLGTMAA